MAIIKLENINQVFGHNESTKIALGEINLEIEQGDFVVVMGLSGSGKTCLLNILGLLTLPATGLHTFLEQEINYATPGARAKLRCQEIGFIFQNFNLIPYLNIVDNIALPLNYANPKLSSIIKEERIKKILNRVGIYNKESLYPDELGAGQKQLVGIVRAIINRPSLILADEPTGQLEGDETTLIMDILENIHDKKTTIVVATDNPNLTKLANKFIYLHEGRICINQTLRNQQIDLSKIQGIIRMKESQRRYQSQTQNEALASQQEIPITIKPKKK